MITQTEATKFLVLEMEMARMWFWRDALATMQSIDWRGGLSKQEPKEELLILQDFTKYLLWVIIMIIIKALINYKGHGAEREGRNHELSRRSW